MFAALMPRESNPVGCDAESQNHRTVWVVRDLKDHLIPSPAMDRDATHWLVFFFMHGETAKARRALVVPRAIPGQMGR